MAVSIITAIPIACRPETDAQKPETQTSVRSTDLVTLVVEKDLVWTPIPPKPTLAPLTAEAYQELEQQFIDFLLRSYLPFKGLVTAQREWRDNIITLRGAQEGPVKREWPVSNKHHQIQLAIGSLTESHATVHYLEVQEYPSLMTRAPEGIVADINCYEIELVKEPSGQWTTVSQRHLMRGHRWG